jgi:DNA-binding MarR family transcriptional regulator
LTQDTSQLAFDAAAAEDAAIDAAAEDAAIDAAAEDAAIDSVDRIIEQWHRERPDLDPAAKAVTGRIVRLNGILQRRMGDAFARHGLNGGTYGILAALRRAGAPFELTPSELTRHLMVTTGGMTAMIDRLERQGLVARRPNPDDRRGVLVRLTDEGRAIVDAAMVDHTAAEHELVAGLSTAERDELARLLRVVLLSLEGPA